MDYNSIKILEEDFCDNTCPYMNHGFWMDDNKRCNLYNKRTLITTLGKTRRCKECVGKLKVRPC